MKTNTFVKNEYFTLYKPKKLTKPKSEFEFGYEEYTKGFRKYSTLYIKYRFGKQIKEQEYIYFYKNTEEAIEDLRNFYAGKELQNCILVTID